MAHCQIALCDSVPVLSVGEAPIVLRIYSLTTIVFEPFLKLYGLLLKL